MKAILALFAFVIGISANGRAQGAFQFTADIRVLNPLPGQEAFGGQGVFSLEGKLFQYRVVITPYAPVPDGVVRGPGWEGPVLFDLAFIGCQPPLGADPGSCGFRGTFDVPDSEIADLMANNWYVRASIHADVDVNFAGRIELVPEPAPASLLCLFAAVSYSAWFCHRIGRRRARIRDVQSQSSWPRNRRSC